MSSTPSSDTTKKTSIEGLALEENDPASAVPIKKYDEVFGAIKEDGPDYRNVGWMAAVVLLLKSQIGLGVLSLPSALGALGIVPGILVLVGVSAIMTWSGYCVGQFKLRHRQVYSVVDVGEIMFGPIGKEIFAAIYCTFMIFVAGSAIVGASIGLNAISLHATCTAVFVIVSTIVTFSLASIRTLGNISWLGWVGLTSIVAAIITLTIAVGIQDRPALAPQTGDWDKGFNVIGNPTFLEASSAVASLVVGYAGVPTYFSIAAEMRDPRLFNRAMFCSQVIITAIYIAIGTVVYFYCGQYVASPALGSAGVLMKRICYGLALPGLYVTGTIYLHLPAKYVFLRVMRGSKHLTSNSPIHWAVWLSCVFTCVTIAYIIASAIPVFGSLVGLIGALFGSFFCIMVMGATWIFDHQDKIRAKPSMKVKLLTAFNCFIILLGLYLMISGTWGAAKDISDSFASDGGTSPWSCKDNSNTVE
ncbi:hypothetical protein L198_06148 [Cryptococcus wingfieldii CBS 7118]|uniref:Amino acid transporter transmembrane domain-containing protein n=1 Tax=Cryptococcus wingfieldii CBS 7118 TaxID=1295528 RepID=A0A1E3IT00_9TREE|nr:hypothetical protein L198_06148 [Cryptococcus wingfieldii CBS 7118]ODN90831.1 hypothetical protein L198_06148 [Cryptococcus wingfieldii CBS 7118]